MRKLAVTCLFVWSVASCCGALRASDSPILEIRGRYLADSYDFNQIFGRDATFDWGGYSVSCVRLKVDVGSRAFLALGRVTLTKGDESL